MRREFDLVCEYNSRLVWCCESSRDDVNCDRGSHTVNFEVAVAFQELGLIQEAGTPREDDIYFRAYSIVSQHLYKDSTEGLVPHQKMSWRRCSGGRQETNKIIAFHFIFGH